MDKIQAFHSFWSQFADAYDQSTVPDSAKLPYITYEVSSDDFDNPVTPLINIWDRSTSWKDIESIRSNIESVITRGGIMWPYDGGAMWIKRSRPFAQRIPDTDDMIRRYVLNLEVEFMD